MILLIDDLRSFRDGRPTHVARTSAAGIAAIDQFRNEHLDAIYLDHDLGEISVDGNIKVDSVMPCVDRLCELSFLDSAVDVDVIYVHTSNPTGRDQIMLSLRRFGYNVQALQAEDYFTAWDLTKSKVVPLQEGEQLVLF